MMQFKHAETVPWSSSHFSKLNRRKTTSENKSTGKITSCNKKHKHKQQKYKWQCPYDEKKRSMKNPNNISEETIFKQQKS